MSTPETTIAPEQTQPPAVATPTPPDTTGEITTLDAWSKNKEHVMTLPSGSKVKIVCPDLPNLIRTGQIPNALINVAIGVANGKKVTAEDIQEQAQFYNELTAMAVVEPQITTDQVAAGMIPTEDKEMIVELAIRQRDFDAVGHHIGGLETNADFRNFRGLLPLDAFGGGV